MCWPVLPKKTRFRYTHHHIIDALQSLHFNSLTNSLFLFLFIFFVVFFIKTFEKNRDLFFVFFHFHILNTFLCFGFHLDSILKQHFFQSFLFFWEKVILIWKEETSQLQKMGKMFFIFVFFLSLFIYIFYFILFFLIKNKFFFCNTQLMLAAWHVIINSLFFSLSPFFFHFFYSSLF